MNAIVDTSALLDGFDLSLYEQVYIPGIVYSELDAHKLNKNKDVAQMARKVIKDILRVKNITPVFECSFSLPKCFALDVADNIILSFAKDVQTGDKEAVLFTSDAGMLMKAKYINIRAEHYTCSEDCEYQPYDGYHEVTMNDNEVADFYSSKQNKWGLKENQYLIIRNSYGDVVDKLRWTSAKGFVGIYKKAFDSIALDKFKAKDVYQECAMDSIVNTDFSILTGPAGSAKTLMSLSYILQEIASGNRARVVIVSNQIELKGTKGLGFLPGSAIDKQLYGSIGGILSSKLGSLLAVEQLIAQGKLLLIPASGIRGIEVGDKDILFCTESQNTNAYLLKTIIQRAKEGCKVIIEGDIEEQVDLDCFAGNANGMRRAIQIFAGEKCFSTVRLKNIYRSQIANIAQNM